MKIKIKISKSELVRVLTEGGSFAGKGNIMPILDAVKISVYDGQFSVTSTNTDDYVQSFGICESSTDVEFCVSSKEITSYISSISDDDITLEYDEVKGMLYIAHTNGDVRFKTVSTAEFPSLPSIKDVQSIEIPSGFLSRWLNVATNFTQNTNGVSVLDGVHICSSFDGIRVFGSDRKSIFIGYMKTSISDEFGLTILPTVIPAMSRLMKNCETVNLCWNDNRMSVRSDSFVLSTKLLEQKYPDLCKFLLMRGDNFVEVDASKMLTACKRIKTQLHDGFNDLCISHADGIMSLRYEVIEYSKHVLEKIKCEGDDFGEVRININRLINVLNSCTTPTVRAYYSDGKPQPLFIESDYGDYRETYGISPMV